MPNYQLVLASSAELSLDDTGGPYLVDQHSGTDRILQAVDRLGEVWEVAVERLSGLATTTRSAVAGSPFELDSIEFNLGIEAGLTVGLVTKGEASVSLRFTRRPEAGDG
ncbi:hypothetical protein Cch01nite_19650 [Cellulomonas chitinilytica]|uniref:Uncharacterized protein n=1 Tax=Cellulomonas chitinilytica TaxID=398759 RepID=A0A919P434_9CELL|nr:hypothetical protein [Cellulomonas chitinilytica]GIG21241.1 hypothetical protein Cch01nite_19650 [Cellulomonas chitinilytica]